MNQLADGSLAPPWVVLCGAGISVAPPSSVPSWWGFNQAVLEELRSRFTQVRPVPVRAVRALERLSLDRLDVTEFSQIVSDAFAGETWFESLEVLDGREPNANHTALAGWAASGRLAVILTTNFDTLIERALERAGVQHAVFDALLDEPPDSGVLGVVVVKVHGTVSRRGSLVDLASQKRRGLPPAWRVWLEQTFADHHVAVAGFSGADLALGADYLRLRAAANRTPELRWLHRPGQPPSAGAQAVIRSGAGRFHFVDGDLPAAWGELGAPDGVLGGAGTLGVTMVDDAQADVSAALDHWLEHPMVDPDTCGLALSRLLDASASHAAAQSLRTSILTRVRRQFRAGVGVTAAARAGLQIGQLAGDEPLSRAEQAIYCLGLADRALGAVVAMFDPEVRHRADVEDELAHDRATIFGNIAYFEVRRGNAAAAQAAVDIARDQAERLSGVRRLNHDAAYLEITGTLAFLSGDRHDAQIRWAASRDLSLQSGNARRVLTTSEALARAAKYSPAPPPQSLESNSSSTAASR